MSGTADLVAAFAGGGRLSQDSYNRELMRLTAAKSQQALMDKRVAEAATATTANQQFQNIPNLEGIDPRMAAMMQSDTAAAFSAGQQGVGREQDNQLQAMGMEVAEKFKNSGADPADVLNMLNQARGSMAGPGNVNTTAQAGADIDYTEAATANQLASAFSSATQGGKNQAATSKINEEIRQLQLKDIPGLEIPDVKTIDMLFPPGLDEAGEYLENPDAAQFLRWYPNAAATTPELKNLMAAYAEFKKRKDLAPAGGADTEGNGTSTRPTRPTRQELYTPTDYSGMTDAQIDALLAKRGIQY